MNTVDGHVAIFYNVIHEKIITKPTIVREIIVYYFFVSENKRAVKRDQLPYKHLFLSNI